MLPRLSSYPDAARERDAERDKWIIARRGQRNSVDPLLPYAFFTEDERNAAGEIVPTATVLLTNRECPWRCVMCDLWRNTLTETVPAGAIPRQIGYALQRMPTACQIKLYNSGSFFDARAIPPEDHPAIALLVNAFERVIVECHPALVNQACVRFAGLLSGKLEVAMGLETVHPETLARLNKRMTTEQFASAAQFLREQEIDLRVFILVKPPFMPEEDAVEWVARSLDFAFACGATAATLIPTRGGNGAMEELAAAGEFSPPALKTLEAAAECGVLLSKGRVFADLWNAEASPCCAHCRDRRIARLRAMNLEQKVPAAIECEHCAENR
jgi:radical SAM enzyme (TIGR01210 family)